MTRTPSLVTVAGRRDRSAAFALLVPFAAIMLLVGCGGDTPPATAPSLLLSGPETNIVATIPEGWHQVINSANPMIPQMVAPVDCMGSNEVGCASGLARIATTTAPSVTDAARSVAKAVTSGAGVTAGPVISEGPGKVGQRDGYRQRFAFSNARSGQTAEVAAVASGPVVPDAQGNREFSVVLVWITDQPGAPPAGAIDSVVSSVLVHGGESAR